MKVSDAGRDQVKTDFWAIFDLPDDVEPVDAAVAETTSRTAHCPTGQQRRKRSTDQTVRQQEAM